MDTQTIQVNAREPRGKSGARKLRRSGRIPAVLYGHKEPPIPLDVDPRALNKCLRDSGRGGNTVFRLEGLTRGVLALIKDSDVDPVRRALVHVDLIEVREEDRVVVDVPVRLDGKAAGVIDGGVVQPVSRSLPIRCSPLAIPAEIVVDVTPLRIGQSLHGRDIVLPAGSELAVTTGITLVTVKAPREAAEPTTEAAAAPAESKAAAPAKGGPAKGGSSPKGG